MKSNELKAPYETPELNETAVSVERMASLTVDSVPLMN